MNAARRSLVGVALVALLLAGCGGDEAAPEPPPAVDGTALQNAMPGFVSEVADDLGRISPPIYVDADKALLGFVPEGTDPVEFCDRLADYVADEGFDGVPINIVETADSPEFLATGTAGGDCS